MKIIISRQTPRWLRAIRYILFVIGFVAFAYVGLTLLDARLYQASAKSSLERQIQMEPVRNRSEPRPAVKMGDVLGRLDIPRLGLSVAISQGTTSRILRLGAGHIIGTPLPGEAGNSVIAAHRDTFFRELKDVHSNDEIQIQTAAGLFRYQVDWVKIVSPDDAAVLGPSTEATLTLITCYPFYFVGPAPKRFVVHARAGNAGTDGSDPNSFLRR